MCTVRTEEHHIADLTRSYRVEAINTLVELMRDGKDERLRGIADQTLLDRGWGKRQRSWWLRALRAAIWTS